MKRFKNLLALTLCMSMLAASVVYVHAETVSTTLSGKHKVKDF